MGISFSRHCRDQIWWRFPQDLMGISIYTGCNIKFSHRTDILYTIRLWTIYPIFDFHLVHLRCRSKRRRPFILYIISFCFDSLFSSVCFYFAIHCGYCWQLLFAAFLKWEHFWRAILLVLCRGKRMPVPFYVALVSPHCT